MASLRILLTGAKGFLGCHLERALRDTHMVFAPGHADLDLLDEVGLRAWLDRHSIDLVIHAATWNATATSPKPREVVLENNLRMFFNLAGERHRYGRLVHFGSGAEFDRAHWREDLQESELGVHPPRDAYGFSKYVAAAFTNEVDNISNLRLFGVMGPGEDWRIRFPSGCVVRALFGLPLSLRQDRRFDYLGASDVASALLELIHVNRWPRTLNLCRGEAQLLSDLAAHIQRIMGTDLPLNVTLPGMERGYGGDAETLRALLPHWAPRPLDEALGELCRHLAAGKGGLDPGLLVNP